jgi:aldose 1-epimerase
MTSAMDDAIVDNSHHTIAIKRVFLPRKLLLFVIATVLLHSLAYAQLKQENWGRSKTGEPIYLYTLTDGDFTVRITNFGARVVSILTPDRSGKLADVVLGYDNSASYENDKLFFGALVGRYSNRISGGSFSIDGKSYQAALNDGPNSLHGGPQGFFQKVWTGRIVAHGVELTLVSPDGDMGFPGQLTVKARYTVAGESLHIDYSAQTTKPTIVSLTNHSYFNLKGDGRGTILDEILQLNASRYTPIREGLIPTGEIANVAGTPFDFRKPSAIGTRIHAANEQLKLAGGYGQNFVLDAKPQGNLHLAAKVYDPESGRTLTITTTEPGIQFHSGNFLNGSIAGKGGNRYGRYAAVCLETQHFPDSPHHPAFPSTLLRPGQTLHSTSIYTFGIQP